MQHERHSALRRTQGTLNRIEQMPPDMVSRDVGASMRAGNFAEKFQCRDPRLVEI